MLNHWLNKKNNLIVFRFRFRGAEKINKPCTFYVLRGIFVSLGNEQKIGGAKNIFDFEYDFESANMPLVLLNVTTCLHVFVI